MYRDLFLNARAVFEEKYGRNLVIAFKKFQDLGVLEIITSAATHGFLPLMQNRNAVRAQIMVAVEHHKKHLGRAPKVSAPGVRILRRLEEVLHEAGIGYFFTDAHGVFHARPSEVRVYAPIYTVRAWPHSAGTSNRPSRSGAPSKATRGLQLPGFLP